MMREKLRTISYKMCLNVLGQKGILKKNRDDIRKFPENEEKINK